MLTISTRDMQEGLAYPELIEALRAMFKSGATAPLRHHHTIPGTSGTDATVLLMPAWSGHLGFGGVKLVNVNPDNAARNLPSINASYLLFDAATGQHLCLMEGKTLTARRTAAASALAASYLARPDSSTLLIVGAGAVGNQLAAAFGAVLPIDKVLVWSRSAASREALVKELSEAGWDAAVPESLEAGVRDADVISCATFANEPIIKGEWLCPGQHIDLIGSFTPAMREVDDMVMQRARIFVDTDAAIVESGELLIPLKSGAISESDIVANLYALCASEGPWRQPQDITLFKGVGHAVEDLAAAILVYKSWLARTDK